MPSRHQGREYALQMLYQSEVGETPIGDVAEHFFDGQTVPEEERRFAVDLARGTILALDDIDVRLRGHLENWRLERLGIVDRAVLRLAVFEFLNEPETPRVVVIDEAIELAKKFGGDESGQFVNGILDAVRKNLGDGMDATPSEPEPGPMTKA
jgi:N utilization substance protein B